MDGSGSGGFMRLQSRCRLWLPSSGSPTGAGRCAPKKAHSHAWQGGLGGWQAASVPLQVGSERLLTPRE